MPGTDHAGIATQNVVEKRLTQKGLNRQDLGREKFLEEVWKWRNEYGSTIIHQLKKLGCSCDWKRTRFTMDEEYSRAVTEVFVSFWNKGLIYQGEYIINWCPRCQTALSDEEAPHHDMEGLLYYIKYPLKDSDEFVTVATTRPETMLGDVAVAVNPRDRRYKSFYDKTIILPLVEREIRIIKDKLVDPKFGTGAVKVTPAHDPNDFIMGRTHGLKPILVMNPDGTMNEEAGDFAGMDRFEAREAIIEELRERKLLLKVEPHHHAVGHCYRCHTIVEPYLSRQWFVSMKPLAKPAIEAVKKGEIKFYPRRWSKVYLNWMQNIHDWCISRQIWWGHRLPVYYCRHCRAEANQSALSSVRQSADRRGIIVSREKPQRCPDCNSSDIYQDDDVLDTWFSSWLWPFATFGWPFSGGRENPKAHPSSQVSLSAVSEERRDLDYFYPTSVLVTASEIIFFWVARMIMAGYEFTGKKPFSDVYIHGTVRDATGKKMSKSLGNIIDPLEIIDEFGADALRFSLISLTSMGQDVFLSREKFEFGRNFANKIWNASRFVIMNIDREKVNVDLCQVYKRGDLPLAERWILSRFYTSLKRFYKALDSYRLNEAANILYEFFWHEFCDWYLEMAKLTIKEKSTQITMYKVLEKTLRIIHPFMPHITEEVWHRLNPDSDSIMIQNLPHMQKDLIDTEVESEIDLIFALITSIRNIRAQMNIRPEQKLTAILVTENRDVESVLDKSKNYISHFARLQLLEVRNSFKVGSSTISDVVRKVRLYIPLEGAVDIEKEKKRLSAQLVSLEEEMKNKQSRLRNKEFLKKAPGEVVEKEKARLNDLFDTEKRLKKILSEL